MNIPESGRQSAHVLIDAVSVAHGGGVEAVELAYQRLAEVRGFAVHATDDGDRLDVNVDLGPVLGAALVTMGWLVESLSAASGQPREEIIMSLREYVDE